MNLNAATLRKIIEGVGIDLRCWCSYGTVGVVGDDGSFDPTDQHAIMVGPSGVKVDCLLELLNIPITASWAGLSGGKLFSGMVPIRPGDRVLINLPDGDPTYPEIVKICHSDTDRLPLEGRRPIFDNTKVSIWSAVDVDIKAPLKTVTVVAGKEVFESDDVRLGGEGANHQVPQGDLYKQAFDAFLTALNTYASAIQGIADPTSLATTTLTTAIATMKAAEYLSPVTRTR